MNDDDNDDCATLQLTRASALSSECTLTLFAHDDDDLIVMWKKLIEMILIAITYEWYKNGYCCILVDRAKSV